MTTPQEYSANGWALCVAPRGEKGPTTVGWNRVPADPNAIDTKVVNVGLLHALSGTMALDIDDTKLAMQWLEQHGISLPNLLSDPASVQIRSGRENSRKLLYSLPFPLPTKKVIVEGKTALEFRCSSENGASVQDLLPGSLHPTGTTYEWGSTGDWKALPVIPDALLSVWVDLLKPAAIPDAAPVSTVTVDAKELASALQAIDPSCDRKVWIECLMGVKVGLGEDGRELSRTWSKGSDKYPGDRAFDGQWNSLVNTKPHSITAATVFKHAHDAGWVRPAPDVTKLFSAVVPEPIPNAKEVVDRLDAMPPPPAVDLSLWPNVLVRRALEVADEVGCDPVVPLLAGLSAVSAAVDKRTSLTINPTWVVPPNIWLMTIGEPSDKKTPGSKPMFAPLKKLEFEDLPRHEAELLIWQGKEARHAAELKIFRDWQASPEATFPGATPPMVTPLPPMPQPLRLTVTDATTQKVVMMSAGRPRGFLLYLDEMNRWFEKLADGRGTDDRGCWVHGYETGRYTMDRVGAGTIEVENMALSIYGNCQPRVFVDSIDSASKDGIMQRFLPAILDSSKNKGWKDALPEFMSSAHEYEQLIRRTYATQVMQYKFSPEALTVFKAFSVWTIETQRGEKRMEDSIPYQTALGKLDGQTARLIQLFHIVEDPHNPLISAATTIAAINVMKRFFYPSLRHTFIEVAQQRNPLSKSIMTLLIQWAGEKETVTISEIRRLRGGTQSPDSRKAPWHTDQMIRVTMDELATMKYVHLVTDHPRYPVWAINPALATLFKDERREIIAVKAARQDNIVATVLGATGKAITPSGKVIGRDSI